MIRKFYEAVNHVAPRNIILALLVLATGHSMAQDASAREGNLVGNRPYSEAISGSLHPVKVITRRDIELSGVKRIKHLLGRASFNNFGIARPLRTLTLINGRRVSDAGVDTDTIPIAAVERIEIFGDSTSALHG
ncbi:MAG: TonB-dependent receptor plug domain-containing protein, partial [Candidatus Dadabacteria bacterium]|nr:TonB-dependent receptor plug domain-containing protein [Candidatus Dadabacteria bacterium]